VGIGRRAAALVATGSGAGTPNVVVVWRRAAAPARSSSSGPRTVRGPAAAAPRLGVAAAPVVSPASRVLANRRAPFCGGKRVRRGGGGRLGTVVVVGTTRRRRRIGNRSELL